MAVPVVIPTLNLNFAKSRKLDNRITFTRASTATYVGADGVVKTAAANEARFTHDPATLESLGLLIEASATNFLLNSEDFSAWSKNGTAAVSVNQAVSPDGATTGDRITSCGTYANRIHQLSQAITGGSVFVFTFWAKNNGGGNDLAFKLGSAGGTYVESTGNVTLTSKWVRYSLALSTVSGNTGIYPQLWGNNSTTSFDIWGAQLENSEIPTSYIKTTTSAVTRAADSAIMSGSNFSSWFNAVEGSVYVASKFQIGTSGYRTTFAFHDGGNSHVISQRCSDLYNDEASFYIINGVVTDINITAPTAQAGEKSVAVAYANSDAAVSCAGDSPNLNATITIPAVSRLQLGALNGIQYLNGTIARLAFIPKRLANADLQTLSSR